MGAYFVLVGLFYLLGASAVAFGVTTVNGQLDALTLAISGLVGVLGLAYLTVGLRLKKLLASNPAAPLRLAVIGVALSVLRFNVISILLNVYIIYQLKRLATEAVEVTESRTLD